MYHRKVPFNRDLSLRTLLVLMTAMLFLILASTACSQSEAELIREINEAAATTPVATLSPLPKIAPVATPPVADGDLTAKIEAMKIAEGDCIESALPDDISIETVEIVLCSGPWEFRVLSLFQVDAQGNYPGDDYFGRLAWTECDPRYSYYLLPSPETWEFGDRTVHCLQESFGLSEVDPAKLDRLKDLATAAPGECFNEAPETDGLLTEQVNCSGPWEYRVVSLFQVDDQDNYPGDDYFGRLAWTECDPRYSYYLLPSPENWEFGDRTVHCLQESFGLSEVDPAKLDRLKDLATAAPGECFNEAPETDGLLTEQVNCSGPWEFQVTKPFTIPLVGEYPGTEYFDEQATAECPKADSHLIPTFESWALGDRLVLCIITNPS